MNAILKRILQAFAVLILSGLLGAALVRISPGSDVSEQDLDTRLSSATLESLRRERAGEQNVVSFYGHFLLGLLRGDAGRSRLFDRPVAGLIQERLMLTTWSVMAGLFWSWSAALILGVGAALSKHAAPALAASFLNGALLSVPSAVVAVVCLLLGVAPFIAIAAVVFPRLFPHVYEQCRAVMHRPHVIMARARGLSEARVFFSHIAPSTFSALLALAGISATLAFGASIPVEALADFPGLGQLAWRAALGRDMPLLVAITLLFTAVTVLANLIADLAIDRLRSQS